MSATRPEINVHPKTRLPSSLKTQQWDVIVIGSGPAGFMCALRTVAGGLSTLLIESELVGGECPFWACQPSKGLLRPDEALESAYAVGGAREVVTDGIHRKAIRPEGTWKRRDAIVKNWEDTAYIDILEGGDVTVVHGLGKLVGEKKVAIVDWHSKESIEVVARKAVVFGTGSEPVIPKIDGLQQVSYWTPREAVSASEVPDHLIVLGAGVVGTELATAYRQLGSKVTLLSRASRILPKVALEASKRVQAALTKNGVDIRLNASPTSVKQDGSKLTVLMADGSLVEGSVVLVAAGRRARVDGLNLDSLGIDVSHGYIPVDESLCVVSLPWLYAPGDAGGRGHTTHEGHYHGVVAGAAIIAKVKGTYEKEVGSPFSMLSIKASSKAIPQVVFTNPQVAIVGLNLEQARQKGMKVREISMAMSAPGVMIHSEGYDGWVQWVMDEAGKLIGATFVGTDVVNLLHATTVAITAGLTWQQMYHAIPSFPTMTDVFWDLSLAASGQMNPGK